MVQNEEGNQVFADEESGNQTLGYISLGCWKDTRNRAIPTLEGTDPRLDGHVTSRNNAIEKCFQVALSRGFPMFAVQASGQCFGSADGLNTYNKYGPSTACTADGEGGGWANEVYKITGFTVWARSCGKDDSTSPYHDTYIVSSGQQSRAEAPPRGYQAFILDERTGTVVHKATFDTNPHGGGVAAARNMTTFLQGVAEVFEGNTDRNSPVRHLLVRPVTARFVRFYPLSWNGFISMRMEVLLCAPETCGLSSFHHFPQTRCPGNTVTFHSDVTLQFCVEACCKDPSCLSFNYNTMSKCRLKNYVCSAEEKEVSSIGNMYDRIVGPDGNIALGKAAFQTSTNWDADGPASRAVDGNTDPDLTNGKSCTHTNGEDSASWWVDLGQAYMVDRVVIYNRMDWGPERLNPFNIHIGDSDKVSANPMCGGNHQIDVTKPSISVPCPGMRGRYVGVRLPGSNRKLSLCEVKIFPGETPGVMAALTTTQSPPTTLSVSTATTPGQKTAYGCRHEYLQLSCAEGETLWILDANFGRTSTTHPCSSCNNCPTDCRAASSLSVVRSACQGQRQCSVLAHHSVFGDPCPGINKYLEASYRCTTGAGWLERSAEWVITATKTSYPNSGGPDKVLDGDSESHWNPVVSDSWFITFDLGVPHTLSKISLTNFGDTAHDILNFRLQTSLVSSPYVWKNVMRPAETNVAATANPQEFGDLSFTGRFWRFNVTKTHGALQPWLRELNFFGARLGADTCGLSTFRHVPETDCFGAEIAIHYGVTLQFCADACCAASSCLSFQYNSGSSCYLKTKLCSGAEKVYTGGGNMYDWFVGQGSCRSTSFFTCKYPDTSDGHWSQWGSWSGCDVTCGIGNQLRSRSCDNPPPVGGGANCIGDSEETRTCDTGQPCPVDGNWSQWTSWSGCDATCGFGKQSRSRRCDNPSPLGGGAGCAGESEETQVCVTGQPCPVNGNWSLWTSWSNCDVTCGFGNQSRNRSCDNPPPQHGGANCTGTLEEFRTCDSGQPCAGEFVCTCVRSY
ncbi:uncharacterized protein LOC144884783 [Branchiostoma floridae x Branchiostoma japonicum]